MTTIAGVTGRLISSTFALGPLKELSGVREAPAGAAHAIERWNSTREASLGPAASVRAVADVAAIPLLRLLGFDIGVRRDAATRCDLIAAAGRAALPVVVVGWSESLETSWRAAVVRGIVTDARWCLSTNGRALRLVDAHRTWARQHLEFDLGALGSDALRLLWTLVRPEAIAGSDPLLDRAVRLSARHGVEVCAALGKGVLDALGIMVEAFADAPRRAGPPAPPFEPAITVLYRVLFLLFAEGRGLVPTWHPVYRDRYTIDAIVAALAAGERCRGVWRAVQAISRLAHAGCRAGDLRVTAFNGRLFSPLHTPGAERRAIDDDAMSRALLALGTTSERRSGRSRISYRDLDVEQLGAVYEHVLDYEPRREGRRVTLRRTGDLRKTSGTFYTPRSVAGYLVRRTLQPLVRDRSAEEILALRVLDPAMGSGAFLVGACRYLAGAAEEALVRDGEWHAADVTPADRLTLRREVAQRCLYGVDLNPMAVQLARLSLWLATLAADRPLSFLDHRLVTGDSLVGAFLVSLMSRPPGGRPRRRAAGALPLFDVDSRAALGDAAAARSHISLERDEDVQVVRRKEAVLASLRNDGSKLMRWKAVLDLWCACWFWDDMTPPTDAVFHELSAGLLHGGGTLPARLSEAWHERARAIAARRRFLHWEIEFPEVFIDPDGRPHAAAGFDAVIGNPPWDMVRGDSGGAEARDERRADARRLMEFVRGAGIYAGDAGAHVNRYQLFIERVLQLVRPGGRMGLVLPSGLISDAGCAPLRRRLFDRAGVDTVVGLDNRAGVFPIHRSVRFVLLTASAGVGTTRVACRFGVTDPHQLDAIGEESRGAFPVELSRTFLARVSGEDDLGVPELGGAMDLRIVEKVAAAHAWLSADDGWRARFGRELNATDDRDAFTPATRDPAAIPVLEGKHVFPFRVAPERSTWQLRPSAMLRARVPRRSRLAYRDVASATNRLTLIAAIVPARAVTTHTLFCLKTPLSNDRQLVLCALLNSWVANYLVRMRVGTHVTASVMSRLPVPWIPDGDAARARLRDLARRLGESDRPVEQMAEYADLQALVAQLYGLTRLEFEHVLATFPLIPDVIRSLALAKFVGARR